jgi:hypothetical protein
VNDMESRFVRLETALVRWRAATALVALIAVAAFLVASSRQLTAASQMPAPPAVTPAPASPAHLTLDSLKVRWLSVVDAEGNTVISMNEGAGGGILSITSAAPTAHNVTLMASSGGATVQVSSQVKPRQFGLLKIMDRKPYLQMYEEQEGGGTKHFYQAPVYSADGSIGGRAAAE